MQSVRVVLGEEVVALDGQAMYNVLNEGENPSVIVSVWATGSGLLLGQCKIRNKSNEITAMPELLHSSEIAEAIVNADRLRWALDVVFEGLKLGLRCSFSLSKLKNRHPVLALESRPWESSTHPANTAPHFQISLRLSGS